ncbi:MAG: type II toxin-antitoxin system HicB family antitoxin [Pseudomonadota bacterium]
MDILKYKGYEGSADIDMARHVCRGKILFISDVVTYEAASPAALQMEFEAAVDDYLATCKQLDRAAQKPLKGQFNVRVPPELHKAAVLRAMADSVSLNEVVVNAIGAYLSVASDASQMVDSAPPSYNDTK